MGEIQHVLFFLQSLFMFVHWFLSFIPYAQIVKLVVRSFSSFSHIFLQTFTHSALHSYALYISSLRANDIMKRIAMRDLGVELAPN